MGKPIPSLDESTDLAEAYRILLGGSPALVVTRAGRPLGLVSRFDLITTFSHRDSYEI